MTTRTTRRRAPRRAYNRNNPQLGNAVLTSSAVKATPNITVTFNQAVTLLGVPTMVTNGAVPRTVDNATQTAPNVVVFHCDGALAASQTTLIITPNDPMVRGYAGGFLTARNVALT